MKKKISDVVSELEIIKKSHALNSDYPLVSIGEVNYSIDDVLLILKNHSEDDDLYKAVEEGISFL